MDWLRSTRPLLYASNQFARRIICSQFDILKLYKMWSANKNEHWWGFTGEKKYSMWQAKPMHVFKLRDQLCWESTKCAIGPQHWLCKDWVIFRLYVLINLPANQRKSSPSFYVTCQSSIPKFEYILVLIPKSVHNFDLFVFKGKTNKEIVFFDAVRKDYVSFDEQKD